MSTPKRAVETVRLFPVPGAYIHGEPAVEREVSPEEAARLLAFTPPAFTTTPPSQPVAKADEDKE